MNSLKTVSATVRDHIPLEQGLRQSSSFFLLGTRACQRPYSIRTRIKTRAWVSRLMRSVRDHIPLEQGLRLVTDTFKQTGAYVRDHIPLEQGLRPLISHEPE